MHTFNVSQLSSTLQFYNITKITSSRNSQMPDFTILKIVTNSQYSPNHTLYKMHRKNKFTKTQNQPIHKITQLQLWIIHNIHRSQFSQLHNIIENTNLTNSRNSEFQNIHKIAKLETCTNSHLHQLHKLHKTTFL